MLRILLVLMPWMPRTADTSWKWPLILVAGIAAVAGVKLGLNRWRRQRSGETTTFEKFENDKKLLANGTVIVRAETDTQQDLSHGTIATAEPQPDDDPGERERLAQSLLEQSQAFWESRLSVEDLKLRSQSTHGPRQRLGQIRETDHSTLLLNQNDSIGWLWAELRNKEVLALPLDWRSLAEGWAFRLLHVPSGGLDGSAGTSLHFKAAVSPCRLRRVLNPPGSFECTELGNVTIERAEHHAPQAPPAPERPTLDASEVQSMVVLQLCKSGGLVSSNSTYSAHSSGRLCR